MIEIRAVFAISLLLQGAVSFVCDNFNCKMSYGRNFISLKQKFLDMKTDQLDEGSGIVKEGVVLKRILASVCKTRIEEKIKEYSELRQDKFLVNEDEPYFRYYYYTDQRKNQVFSFSALIVMYTCPGIEKDGKHFGPTIKMVDEVLSEWNSRKIEKTGPNGLLDPKITQIKELAIMLSTKLKKSDCSEIGTLQKNISDIVREMHLIFKKLSKLEEFSTKGQDPSESQNISITETFSCQFTRNLDYVLMMPLRLPSLQQLRSMCKEPLYDFKKYIENKPMFLMKVMYPVIKLHKLDQVHCQLNSETIVAANRAVEHFILLDFSNEALENKACRRPPSMAKEANLLEVTDAPAFSLMDLEESKRKDVHDLGQTVMKVTLEQKTLEELGFQYDDKAIEEFEKALGKRIESIKTGFSSSNVSKREYLLNEVMTILMALMAHPNQDKQLPLKTALYFVFLVHSLFSARPTEYNCQLANFKLELNKLIEIEKSELPFIEIKNYVLPLSEKWIRQVEKLIKETFRTDKKMSTKVTTENDPTIKEPDMPQKLQKNEDKIPSKIEEEHIDLEQEYLDPMNAEDHAFIPNKNEIPYWPDEAVEANYCDWLDDKFENKIAEEKGANMNNLSMEIEPIEVINQDLEKRPANEPDLVQQIIPEVYMQCLEPENFLKLSKEEEGSLI